MKKVCLLLSVAGFLLVVQSSFGGMTPVFTTIQENRQDFDKCEGDWTPGGTTLKPFDQMSRDNLSDFANMLNIQRDAIENGPNYSGPSYNYSVSPTGLNGTLTVELYKAYDWENGLQCVHGAGLVADYDWVVGDPILNTDWVQFFDEFGDTDYFSKQFGNYGWIMDGFEDDNPAYWAPGDFDETGNLKKADIPGNTSQAVERNGWTFVDYPRSVHDEQRSFSGGRLFSLFFSDIDLTGYSIGGAGCYDVTFYEGYTWGYEGNCYVPAPGALLLAGMGAGLVGWLRRRGSV